MFCCKRPVVLEEQVFKDMILEDEPLKAPVAGKPGANNARTAAIFVVESTIKGIDHAEAQEAVQPQNLKAQVTAAALPQLADGVSTEQTPNLKAQDTAAPPQLVTNASTDQPQKLKAQVTAEPSQPVINASTELAQDAKPAWWAGMAGTQVMAAVAPTAARILSLTAEDALWSTSMPAAVRRERLIAAMHPRAAAAWNVHFSSGEARKTDVFVDAQEAKPDILVRGEDVFSDPVDSPPSDDASAWWTELSTVEVLAVVNPDCDLTLSRAVKQGSRVKRSLVSVCKVPAAVICAVLYSVIWALKCGLASVVWAVECVAKAAAGLVSSVVKLAGALIHGVFKAAVVLVKGVFCTVVRAGKLAALLVCSVSWALVWTVCAILKAPLYLILAVYYAIAGVFKGLIRGPVALKRAVFGPRHSCCTAQLGDFNPCLSELNAAEVYALINPQRHVNGKVW